MKKNLLLIFLLAFTSHTYSQLVANRFRVSFTDKNNSIYSISNPSAFLSARAIARRTAQNISIKANDLPVNAWYVDSLRHKGAMVLTVSKWFNCATIQTLDPNVLNAIKALPFVSAVDTLAEIQLKKNILNEKKSNAPSGTQSLSEVQPFDFYSTVQSIPTNELTSGYYNYGLASTQVEMIKTDYLHNQGFRGQNVIIAVLDAGFYKVDSLSAFDSLWQNNQILGTKDFVEPGGNVFTKSTHGMMVLSIMGGNLPGSLVGTAPKANYWLLRSEDANTEYLVEEDNWVAAAEFADSLGADVINSSLGYTVFDKSSMDHTYQDMNGDVARATRGADYAASKGIIVVNSAGNSGANTWHYIGAPADADSIITVGAVDDSCHVSSFSSRGPSYDGRIKPTVCAMGEGTFVATTGGTVSSGNGTSFSSPVMTGSVACLFQANPNRSNMDIINAVIASSSHYLSPDADFGYGIPNMMIAHMLLQGLSVENIDVQNSCNVFPNPFSDELNVVFYSQDTLEYSIEIYDLRGRMVYNQEGMKRTQGLNSVTLNDFHKLGKGYYLLKIKSGELTHTTKIFKAQD